MIYLKNSAALLFSFFILTNCSKAGTGDGGARTLPANLAIIADVSTDGSGNVTFTAIADKAVSYVYEFGNGDIKTVHSGIVNYKYAPAGINTFNVTVTATGSSGLSIKRSEPVTVKVQAVAAGLFWSEEFNTDGAPDPAKWSYELGAGGWGNAELQNYTARPENSNVQGGVLKISAIKENYGGSAYTSARLISKNKFEFTYGKVEVRAKIPAGVGTWPAIWMLGSNNDSAGWPDCGEIDIMEHVGRKLNTIYGTLHYPGRSGGNADGSTKVIANATTEFHIYSIEWTAAAIKILVDNELYHTVVNSGNIPFNHDFFFILNIAMGGGLGGDVDPAFTKATMEIDYIRVYK